METGLRPFSGAEKSLFYRKRRDDNRKPQRNGAPEKAGSDNPRG